MADNSKYIKKIVKYSDLVTNKVFPHLKDVEIIIRFNEKMEAYKKDWDRSQTENTEEVK